MFDNKNKIRIIRWLGLALALLISGCASTPPASVEDRSIGRPHPARPTSSGSPQERLATGSYRVQRGDTLYSIAFRNGLDYRDLAAANRINPPYTIFVGQVIRLDGKAQREHEARRQVHSPEVARANPPQSRVPPVAPKVESRPPTMPATPPAVASTPAPQPPAPAIPTTAPPESKVPVAANSDAEGLNWQWPAKGARANGFVPGDQTRQGIDIAGKAGDPVRSAADGVVVYSGNGLIGYGELIIVKHSASMLSAYGHNRRRLVQEGDSVKLGQQIAEMGSTGAKRDMLHFEIRKNGKPVDPLRYLPAQ